ERAPRRGGNGGRAGREGPRLRPAAVAAGGPAQGACRARGPPSAASPVEGAREASPPWSRPRSRSDPHLSPVAGHRPEPPVPFPETADRRARHISTRSFDCSASLQQDPVPGFSKSQCCLTACLPVLRTGAPCGCYREASGPQSLLESPREEHRQFLHAAWSTSVGRNHPFPLWSVKQKLPLTRLLKRTSPSPSFLIPVLPTLKEPLTVTNSGLCCPPTGRPAFRRGR
ncbi:PREDICTED: uncharacterized protein LOC106147584, partial [Chinchilla lanigera]|uniref:uncharacterized protein LOC106147584 n=1 Tax=Chinchilla lanigera TaxID=34839 RepID=UPI0006963715